MEPVGRKGGTAVRRRPNGRPTYASRRMGRKSAFQTSAEEQLADVGELGEVRPLERENVHGESVRRL